MKSLKSALSFATLLLLSTLGGAVMAQTPASSGERFVANADGTVNDTHTGLLWANEDNGNDVDWPAAQSFCQTRGSGWRLPNVTELLRIYDSTAEQSQECIGSLTCKISPLIKVSGLTLWSAEQNTSSEAWYVYFNDGQQYSCSVNSSQGKRALCVKGP